MNPVNDRIKKIRSVLKLTQVNFSKKIFISQGSYNDIETGTRKVNERIIQLICSQFNINKDWLKTGKGEMFYKEKPDIGLEHLIEIYKQLDNPLKEYLLEQSELLLKFNDENKIKKK
jgi:transcriptional regulator with XRE-family HTH domain